MSSIITASRRPVLSSFPISEVDPELPEAESDDDSFVLAEDEDEADLKFNLDNKEFQKSLREDYVTDPLVFARLARDHPDLTDRIIETFGKEVLANMDQLELEPSDDEAEEDEGLVEDDHVEPEPEPEPPKKSKGILFRLKQAFATVPVLTAATPAIQEQFKKKSKIGDKLARFTDISIDVRMRAPIRCAHDVKTGPPDESRLMDTTMATDDGRIHMMLAVTQGLLNNRLKYFWALEEKVRSIDVTLDSGEEIRSYLLPPKIHLEVDTNKPGSAVYWMMFDYGGHIKILDKEEKDGYRVISTDGWKVAFDVDIALHGVNPDSDEYAEIKAKLSCDGDFRISRLLADFQTADIMNPRTEFCYFGGQDLDERTFKALKALMSRWTEQAAEDGLGIMGWSVTTDNPASVNKLPATFTPTDQQLQTYPYMAEGQKEPIIGLDDERANYNMLLYLNMADKKPFPKDRFLDYGGNWCTPNAPVKAPKPPEIHSTLCIGKDVFFHNFIIPHLTLLNSASWLEAKNPGVTYKGGGIVIDWNRVFGGRDQNFYGDWKPISGSRLGGNLGNTRLEKYTGWEWKKSSRGYTSRLKSPLGRGTAEMKTEVSNRIIVSPKGNVIEVRHKTVVYMRTEHRRITTRKGISQIERTGTIKIYIKSVEDGQNMRLDFPTPDNLFTTKVVKYENDFIGKRGTIEGERNSYENALKNNKDFNNAVKKIESALESVGAFVIPTGGTFFLRDGLFNDEGDLLLKASYNGVD